MAIPETPRVIFEHNPLIEVVCQIRFPVLLRLEKDKPVEFQELIYDDYPILEEKRSIAVKLKPEEGEIMKAPKPVYSFISQDNIWRASITSNFIALSTTKYKDWNEFQDKLEHIISNFRKQYNPKYYTRIGLRYKNLIKRSVLDLSSTPAWSTLIENALLGILGSNDISTTNIADSNGSFLIRLSKGMVQVQHGLVNDKDNEECYLIDNDFYCDDNVEQSDARELLRGFNQNSGNLFRWCIADTLQTAMCSREPT